MFSPINPLSESHWKMYSSQRGSGSGEAWVAGEPRRGRQREFPEWQPNTAQNQAVGLSLPSSVSKESKNETDTNIKVFEHTA